MSDIRERIEAVFAAAGAEGSLHAKEIGVPDGAEVSVGGDDQVVLASVFKIPIALAYAREVVAGRLDETEYTKVTARYRIGGIGTAGCADDVEMTWRDLARFMLTMSDNAATDLIWNRIGQETICRVVADLGLTRTRLIGSCEDSSLIGLAELGGTDLAEIDALLAEATDEQLRNLSMCDPERETSSTPRETTELLDAIWTDRAGEPEACERVRAIMAQQIWPHRLSAGFPSGVRIAAKTGTLPGIRNEAGVLTLPEGRRFAVAVFTRAHSFDDRLPAVDASIGAAARLALDHLFAENATP
ncbi:serine hydrolase [Amycolatopsis umgeniensis]|uniref:Beta-lactamase class A n=1 Tax=Amycolatopsis umgeniensis TaxID=336628 RepID=A0A841AXG8_9PSEU|nr:beta-lactamase class A [Amycolatopsis umgeniensis]